MFEKNLAMRSTIGVDASDQEGGSRTPIPKDLKAKTQSRLESFFYGTERC